MLVSVQVLKGVKVLRDWTVILVHDLWTMHCVFEGLASGSEGCGGESWVLDPTCCGLPLVCKVGMSKKGDFQRILLSLAVGDAVWEVLLVHLAGKWRREWCKFDWGSSPHAIMRRAVAEVHYPAMKTVAAKNNLKISSFSKKRG